MRIEYRKISTEKKAPRTKPFIIYTYIYNWDAYTTFSEESRPDSIS